MDYFTLRNSEWCAENVSLNIIAQKVGTPCYVYSRAALEHQWHAFNNAFNHYPHQINYAVKANSSLAILNLFARLNSGFDIVSNGELERVLKAKGCPEKIIFSGVGKTVAELTKALQTGIGCINIESEAELLRLNTLALTLAKKATIAIHVNPDVDPKSHPYISTGLKENKFGINIHEAKALYQHASQLKGIYIQGIAFHIGSQMIALDPFLEAVDKILVLLQDLHKMGINISHLNVGGGLGVRYRHETPPTPAEYVRALLSKLQKILKPQPDNLTIHIEPGRALVANAGVLLTRVEYIKKQALQDRYFAIVDAAMNDLLRPALYNAWQDIVPVNVKSSDTTQHHYDIVGPVCETGDFLGKDRALATLEPNDLLMVRSAGAYGFSMSSNYNSRPRAAEVIVDNGNFYIIRPREDIAELIKTEITLPD
jgi:diaminopimelate decarboxylase